MSSGAVRRRWRGAGQPMLAVAALIAIMSTLVTVVVNGVLLGRMTFDVQVAQSQSAELNNSGRAMLQLLQAVTELGDTAGPDEIAVQHGLVDRHLEVTAGTFPGDSTDARAILRIQHDLDAFDWAALPARGGHASPIRLRAMAWVGDLERRLNTLRSTAEKQFYSTTIESLAVKRRSQIGLAVLVTLVLLLGSASVLLLVRRRRTDIAEAYHALISETEERRAAEHALRASEGRFRSLVQRTSDLIAVTDADGLVTYASPAAEAMMGYQPEHLVNAHLLEHFPPEERAGLERALAELLAEPGSVRTIDLRVRTLSGRIRLVEAVCQNMLADPDVAGIVWNGRDVTERRALQDELTRQAHHDALTGLANRTLLLARLDEAMASAGPGPDRVSVVLVDLDGFKNVNDTFGHAVGDELLQRASERFRDCLLPGDLVARLGGDEFAVVMSGRPEHAVEVAARIVDALRLPIMVAGESISISASAGVAHDLRADSAQDLLRDADIAMYAAKRTGKSRFEVFDPGMRLRASRRTSLQQQLARAVELGELEVHYQPIVDLGRQRIGSLEALVRWRHPDGSLVPPDVFIPLAEESGTILGLGREVLRQACRQVEEWRRTLPGHPSLGIAVNVSVHQLVSGRLVEHVDEALTASGLTPSALTLEITESAMLDTSDLVGSDLGRLKALGVRIAVDDFGSGYSSLGFLLNVDADMLKIDRSLLDFDTTRHGSLVQAISDLGHTLGLVVVAEGVETAEHLARAQDALCDAAQGYFFARPLVPDGVPDVLNRVLGPALPRQSRVG